jgi:hypothetical protein
LQVCSAIFARMEMTNLPGAMHINMAHPLQTKE